jgi:hypothetical protein
MKRKHFGFINRGSLVICLGVLVSLTGFVTLSSPAFALQYGDFTYTVSGGAATITKYTGAGGAVVIPAIINSLPVVGIGSNAFNGCYGLTSVTIPNSVMSIGHYAFFHCSGLTSVTIPASVTSIGVAPFSFCTSLAIINVDASNSAYTGQDGVLYNKGKITLIQYPAGKSGVFTIPDSVTSIGDYAFAGCYGLTSVTIPNSVMSIGSNAFDYCIGLTSVTIPASVTSIGSSAFLYCRDLTKAYFLGNAPSMGSYVFDDGSCDFSVCYTAGSTGFTNPWYSYHTAVCDPTTTTSIAGCKIVWRGSDYWGDACSVNGSIPTNETSRTQQAAQELFNAIPRYHGGYTSCDCYYDGTPSFINNCYSVSHTSMCDSGISICISGSWSVYCIIYIPYRSDPCDLLGGCSDYNGTWDVICDASTTTTTQQTTTTTTAPATLINLSSFTATPKFSKVILQWSTEAEIDNAGFNLYRSETEDGQYLKINDSLIPSQGSTTEGALYELIDKDVKNRKTYYYKLEDVDLNGSGTLNGPVNATPRWVWGMFK